MRQVFIQRGLFVREIWYVNVKWSIISSFLQGWQRGGGGGRQGGVVTPNFFGRGRTPYPFPPSKTACNETSKHEGCWHILKSSVGAIRTSQVTF